MSKNRTISGIPDELWEEAQNTYGNRKVSENIERLLREDLEEKTGEGEKQSILVESDLLDKQKEIVRKLVDNGVESYNKQQWRNFLDVFYARKDYKRKASREITDCRHTPFKVVKGSLSTEEFGCICGANLTLAAYNKADGCPNCGRQL